MVAGIGLSRAGSVIDLDIFDLLTATAVVGDEIAFHDLNGAAETSGSQTRKTTFQSLFNELNVPNAITANGIIVKTADGAPDTYASRTITINGVGNLDGLAITNGSGVAGNPVIGLDVQNLPLRAVVDAALDRVAVWDSSANANVYYTVSDISGALASVNSFETWARAGNGAGASIVADSATDTVTVTGGIGIDIDTVPASDTITWTFSNSGMVDTVVVGADTVPFFDTSASSVPVFRSWTNIISDLGILTGISASANEDLLGIDVTGSVIGLDILGLTVSPAEMATTDEFPVHDKSEGTAGANRKMTGQDIADGVNTILGIPAGLTIATINGQPIVVYTDSTRTKTLSIESHPYQWSRNNLKNNDWVDIGNAKDADTGWIMPLDGTVVMATGFTEDGKSATMDLDLYIDAVNTIALGTLVGAGNAEFTNTVLTADFTQGQKLRIRGNRTAGSGGINDMNVVVIVRWRI